MELQGKVRLLLEPRSGVSQQSGNAWMSQEVVIDYFWWPNQQNSSQAVMRVFGEDRIKQWNLQPNDEVNLRYHIEAHEYQGRWFNEMRIDAVTFIGASAAKNPQPAAVAQQQTQQDGGTGAAPAAAAPTTGTAPQGQEQSTGEGGADDLPF